MDGVILTSQIIFKGKKKQIEWAKIVKNFVINIIVLKIR